MNYYPFSNYDPSGTTPYQQSSRHGQTSGTNGGEVAVGGQYGDMPQHVSHDGMGSQVAGAFSYARQPPMQSFPVYDSQSYQYHYGPSTTGASAHLRDFPSLVRNNISSPSQELTGIPMPSANGWTHPSPIPKAYPHSPNLQHQVMQGGARLSTFRPQLEQEQQNQLLQAPQHQHQQRQQNQTRSPIPGTFQTHDTSEPNVTHNQWSSGFDSSSNLNQTHLHLGPAGHSHPSPSPIQTLAAVQVSSRSPQFQHHPITRTVASNGPSPRPQSSQLATHVEAHVPSPQQGHSFPQHLAQSRPSPAGPATFSESWQSQGQSPSTVPVSHPSPVRPSQPAYPLQEPPSNYINPSDLTISQPSFSSMGGAISSTRSDLHSPQKPVSELLPELPTSSNPVKVEHGIDSKPPIAGIENTPTRNQRTPSPTVADRAVSSKGSASVDTKIRYDTILMTLGEQYIEAAHEIGAKTAFGSSGDDWQKYNELIAAGLACFQSAIKNFRHPPRTEANLLYRFALLAFEETENVSDVEAVLTKGIALCDRNRLVDMKYCMHHLLTRALFMSKPKAALKHLDTVIQEVDTYKNTLWVYALRFLRVSLSAELDDHHEQLAALQHLKAIFKLAEKQNDASICVTCALFEGFILLFNAHMEGLDNAQRAIATARQFQLDDSTRDIKQVWLMLNCLDLMCAVLLCNRDLAISKTKTLQTEMDQFQADESSSEDGIFIVPLGRKTSRQYPDTPNHIFQALEGGCHALVFSWLRKNDFYAFVYLLSSATYLIGSHSDKSRVENFAAEGSKVLRQQLPLASPNDSSNIAAKCSRSVIIRQLYWQKTIQWHLQLYQTCLICMQDKWDEARLSLSNLDKLLQSGSIKNSSQLSKWTTFIRGMIAQGTGNIPAATQFYQSPLLQPSDTLKSRLAAKRPNSSLDDVVILARLNLLFIRQSVEEEPSDDTKALFSELDAILPDTHSNMNLVTAKFLLVSIMDPRDQIIKKKQAMQNALNMARIHNSQLLCMGMNCMVDMFFRSIVGEQAQKSKMTARRLASQMGHPLFLVAADGLLAKTFADVGRGDEAAKLQNEIQEEMSRLPEKVKAEFVVS